jgi:hypothetical protein
MRLQDAPEAVREIQPKVEMQMIAVTRAELRELMRLQKSSRWDWPAVFSANSKRQIWAFQKWGLTRTSDPWKPGLRHSALRRPDGAGHAVKRALLLVASMARSGRRGP